MRVLITEPIHKEGLNMLFKFFGKENITYIPIEEIERGTGLKKLVENINPDALIVRSKTKVTRDVINSARNLKFIGRPGIGLDNIDVDYAEKRGVEVRNTADAEAISTSVAELAIGMVLNLMRKITTMDSSIKKGLWIKRQIETSKLKILNGKIMGIVGLGRIGRKIALLSKAFGMQVMYFDVARNIEFEEKHEASFKPLEKSDRERGLRIPSGLLRRADILTLHLPLTEKTKGILGEKEINELKEGAVVVNTSRGGIVDEKALLKAVLRGKLLGVCLDVYSAEPPAKGPWYLKSLVSLPNVVCTPHIGAQTEEAQREISVKMAELIISRFKGEQKV